MSNDLDRGRGLAAMPANGGAREHSCSGSSRVRTLRADGGQTVVEFAMVLPLVAALLFVLFSFGKLMFYYIDLTHLANEGARYGAVNIFPKVGGLPAASPGAYLCPKLGSDPAVNTRKISVSFDPAANATAGDSVLVVASVKYKLINLPGFSAVQIPLSAGASMRMEQKPTYSSGNTAC